MHVGPISKKKVWIVPSPEAPSLLVYGGTHVLVLNVEEKLELWSLLELRTFKRMGLILHDEDLRCPKWIICFSGLAGFGEYQKWHPITQFGRSGAHAMH